MQISKSLGAFLESVVGFFLERRNFLEARLGIIVVIHAASLSVGTIKSSSTLPSSISSSQCVCTRCKDGRTGGARPKCTTFPFHLPFAVTFLFSHTARLEVQEVAARSTSYGTTSKQATRQIDRARRSRLSTLCLLNSRNAKKGIPTCASSKSGRKL
jgi:hypothetical protein